MRNARLTRAGEWMLVNPDEHALIAHFVAQGWTNEGVVEVSSDGRIVAPVHVDGGLPRIEDTKGTDVPGVEIPGAPDFDEIDGDEPDDD